MVKILSADVLDILPIEIGFIFAAKETAPNGEAVVAAYAYDQDGERVLPIKLQMYLECKFGGAYRQIASTLGDYISGSTAVLKSGGVVSLYPTGELCFFNSDGSVAYSGELLYQNSPTSGITMDGACFWSTVPDRNAIIRYSPIEKRVLLRIGGGNSNAFHTPVAITKIDNKLYICNRGSCKIRTIRLEDYAVKDYAVFKEPVHRFFRVGNKDYALLDSGVYWINDFAK